jgi:hypothetical protein
MNLSVRCAVLALVSGIAACGTVAPCPSGQQPPIHELLYFGTERSTGQVTSQDWEQFLAEVVTPRFPDGLTAWSANGQWRSSSGAIVRESSYVLSLVHPESASIEVSVQQVVAAYKARYAQEAVLRVTSHACMSLNTSQSVVLRADRPVAY